jgi:hypothetical protein
MELMGQSSVIRGTLVQQHHLRMMASLLNNTALSRLQNRASHAIFPKFDLMACIP